MKPYWLDQHSPTRPSPWLAIWTVLALAMCGFCLAGAVILIGLA